MALGASFVWKNADATRDLNARLKHIVLRGVVWGGEVAPGSGLTVDVNPFVGVSFGGMTVGDPVVTALPVAANQAQYVVVRAKYNDLGSPAVPTLAWQVLEESVYNTDPEKDFLIVFCKVTLGAVIAVTPADLDFTVRDEVNPLGRDWYRGIVDDPSFLPPHPPIRNRIGDFYFVKSDQTFHFWDGSAWEPLNTGSYNAETTLMNNGMWQGERDRFTEGTGFIAGIRPSAKGNLAANPDVTFTGTATVVDGFGLDSFSSLVNGHYAELHAQNVQLTTKPTLPGAERYDLVFLEVWRENLSAPPTPVPPESFEYDRNPDGTLTYTISAASDELETISWTAGIAGNNFNLNPIEADGHDWYVVKWRLGNIRDVDPEALYNPNATVVVAAALNVDGVAFAAPPAGADNRVWIATSATTPADGVSWAMPLLVVKRTELENPGGNNGIKEFRNDIRYIFPVYPVCDVSHAARNVVDTVHKSEKVPYGVGNSYKGNNPSGFLTGMDADVENSTTIPNLIVVAEDTARIRVRNLDHFLKAPTATLPAAPTAGWTRQLVYIKMNITLYANDGEYTTTSATVNTRHLPSPTHFPYIPSKTAGIESQGNKRGYVSFEIVAEDLGAVNVLDTDAAMAAAAPSPVSATNWARGDTTVGSGKYADGGIYSRSLNVIEDDRVHPYQAEWAIPVALIHRRNTLAWDAVTNPNGSGSSRPDGRTDYDIISKDDLVDLRHYADVSEDALTEMLKADVDKAMRGQLRTRMANKWAGNGTGGDVAGSRILQTDLIGSGTSLFELSAPNGLRDIWSDAREFGVVSKSFDVTVPIPPAADPLVEWDAVQTLTIKSPAGAYLVRHLPAAVVVDGELASPTYGQYAGPPCWTTRDNITDMLTPVRGKVINTANQEVDLGFGVLGYSPDFTVVSTDSMGRATAMTCTGTTPIPAGTITLSWWVHYDRDVVYYPTHGLAEIPDTVHQVVKGPFSASPEESAIGGLYAVVRVPVTSNSTNITLSDIQAVTGVAGTVNKIIGIDSSTIKLNPAPDPANTILLVALTTAQDIIAIAWNGPPVYNGEADIIVYYETSDVTTWVEVGRGGKSVRAYYEWDEHDRPPAPAPSNYAYSLGNDTWGEVEIENTFSTAFPMVWWKNAPGDPVWTLQRASITTGHINSNLVSINGMNTAGVGDYIRIYTPAHRAPTVIPDDEFQITYTYTPYQGLSSDGGSVAVPATAVQGLKEKIHGTIEANTDYYITQSGACSIYGGVDTWAGQPARGEFPIVFPFTGSHAFWTYNATSAVSPYPATGLQQLNSTRGEENNTIAAAVLRLPFPGNPNMRFPAPLVPYHRNTQDFELDPGREGANAGYRGYAPVYMLYTPSHSYGKLADQFVNGLTRLAVAGEAKMQEGNVLIPASGFTPDSDLDPPLFKLYNSATEYSVWSIPATTACGFSAPIPAQNHTKTAGVMVQVGHWTGADAPWASNRFSGVLIGYGRGIASAGHLDGTADPQAIPYRYIAPDGTVATEDYRYTAIRPFTDETVYLFYYPGTVQENTQANSDTGYPILQVVLDTVTGNDRTLRNAVAYVDTEIKSYYGQWATNSVLTTDLITRPLGSGSVLSPKSGRFGVTVASGITSLKGVKVAYPESWSVATIATLEAGISASTLFFNNYGRGLYLGDTEQRFNMPVLIPGSGDALGHVCDTLELTPEITAQPPTTFPHYPTEPIFANSNRGWFPYDHGGPIAYCFYALTIRPEDDINKNRLFMQIAGGPTMGDFLSDLATADSPNMPDGTAIDAFWPSKRPLLKQK